MKGIRGFRPGFISPIKMRPVADVEKQDGAVIRCGGAFVQRPVLNLSLEALYREIQVLQARVSNLEHSNRSVDLDTSSAFSPASTCSSE